MSTNAPEPIDDQPARTGIIRAEALDGELVKRIMWPIGPPTVTERNVFLVLTLHPNGTTTAQVVGKVSGVGPISRS